MCNLVNPLILKTGFKKTPKPYHAVIRSRIIFIFCSLGLTIIASKGPVCQLLLGIPRLKPLKNYVIMLKAYLPSSNIQ